MTVERGLRLMAGVFILLSVASGILDQPLLVSVHCVCWTEPVPIRTNELVPRDVRASKAGIARVVTTCLERLMDQTIRRNQ